MSKAVKIAFIGSLVINLLLLGVIVGRVPRGLEARPTRQQQLDEALKKIPEPAQSRLREHFTQLRAAGDPLRRQIDQARGEALQLLAAEPFDQRAYSDQVTKIEELRIELSRRTGQKIKQMAQELSPDERRMLADVLRRPSPQPPS
jgi:uncharacterized membrane protein